jgi:glucose-1-phosphate thymidylyltransferase
MNAVVLCAGYATRLYPLTKTFPKPLLPVVDKPVLDYLVDQIVGLPDIDKLHVVTNGRFYDHFHQWAEDKEALQTFTTPIHLHNDGTMENAHRLGAVADLHFVLQRIKPLEPFLVAAADNIFRFALSDLWQQFLDGKHHMVLALALDDRRRLQKTGVLDIGRDNQVVRLHEKPTDPPSNWSCPPIYFFQPSAMDHLDEIIASGQLFDAPGHFIDYLSQKETVMARRVNGTRLDIGDLASYRNADQLLRREPLFT